MSRARRLLGLTGVAARQLRHNRARTVFAVLGIAFAVLSVTLFVGVGVGVQSTGEQLLDRSTADLWVTGGSIEVRPSMVGGFRNPLVDAHDLSRNLSSQSGVAATAVTSFQVVYVGTEEANLSSTLGVGLLNDKSINVKQGSGFRKPESHYAAGNYDGPLTREVIVSPATAERYDLAINDTLHVGGTINNAQQNEFTVVGISPTFESFMRTSNVVVRLSELQTLTGTAYADRATLVSVRLQDGVDPTTVQASIEEAYPELTVRTNRQQFVSVLERQAVVILGGISLVLLGVLSGVLISLNMFLSLMYTQRTDFTIYRAVGGSGRSVLALALLQAAMVGGGGVVLGLLATPVTATGVDTVAAAVTGYGPLVRVPPSGYLLGVGVAAVFGLLGTAVAARRISSDEITRTLGS